MISMIKRLLAGGLTALCAMALVLTLAPSASAEAAQAQIARVEGGQDLVVMFTFDVEVVDIAFLSPSGTMYTAADTDKITMASGTQWATYRVSDAEAGYWSVSYDLGANSGIDYSIVNENLGIWLDYFNLVSLEDDTLTVSFCASQSEPNGYYGYELYASLEDGEPIRLTNGGHRTGEEVIETAYLNRITSGDYNLTLEITKEEGGIELFDTLSIQGVHYTNPNEPDPIEDINVDVDSDNHRVTVNWEDWGSYYCNGYTITILADGQTVYDNQVEGDAIEISSLYPKDADTLTVSLQYMDGTLWSSPLTKTIPLQKGEYLKTDGLEVTGSGQAKLYYKVDARKTVDVSINGGEPTQFFVEGEGFLSVQLNPGSNTLFATLSGTHGEQHTVDTELYYDAFPPEILLYDRLDGTTVQGDSIHILGSITDGTQLTINDMVVPMAEDGSFDYLLPLVDGENLVTIHALDVNGNGAIQTLTLHRDAPTAPVAEQMQNFFPLMAAGGFSFLIILGALPLMKPKEGDKRGHGNKFSIAVITILLLGFEALLCFRLYTLHTLVNSLEFLDIAQQSLTQAAQLVEERDLMAALSIAGGGVLAMLILILVVSAKLRHSKANPKAPKPPKAPKAPKVAKAAEPQPTKRFCDNCGNELPNEPIQFCPKCGAPINPTKS